MDEDDDDVEEAFEPKMLEIQSLTMALTLLNLKVRAWKGKEYYVSKHSAHLLYIFLFFR